MYPASVEYLNRQRIIEKFWRWTLGATADLGFATCDWFVPDFYVYLSLVFSTSYHWWMCLLVWLISSFFFFTFFFIIFFLIYFSFSFIIIIFFILFSFFFWAVWLTGSCCHRLVSGQRCCGGRAEFRSRTTRLLPKPHNINRQKLSQRSPSQP